MLTKQLVWCKIGIALKSVSCIMPRDEVRVALPYSTWAKRGMMYWIWYLYQHYHGDIMTNTILKNIGEHNTCYYMVSYVKM